MFSILFIYLGFNVAFNTVEVISRWVVLWAAETSTYRLVKVLYCKLLTAGKQLSSFPHRVWGLNCRPQRWEASGLPLRHCDLLSFLGIWYVVYEINTKVIFIYCQ